MADAGNQQHYESDDEFTDPLFLMSFDELQNYVCPICLHVVDKCVACRRGHRFCYACVGQWTLARLKNVHAEPVVVAMLDPVASFMVSWLTKLQRFLPRSLFVWTLSMVYPTQEALYRQAISYSHNSCPMCRTDGPFRRDRLTDELVVTLDVRCPLVDHGAACHWTGALEDFCDHDHVFEDSNPARPGLHRHHQQQQQQQQSAAAPSDQGGFVRRRETDDDVDEDMNNEKQSKRRRPVKSFSVGHLDVSVLGYQVNIGRRGIDVSGELSVWPSYTRFRT